MPRLTRRDLATLGGTSALVLSAGSMQYATGTAATQPSAPFDPQIHVNPELRGVVAQLQQYGKGTLSNETLPAARKMSPAVTPLPEPHWSARAVPGPRGAPEVVVYLINPAPADRLRPAVLYMHGGGLVMGDAKAPLRSLQELAVAVDCVVMSVEYRLAPETAFPGSLEDNYAALKWLYDNATEVGVDKSKIALMGESAGGGHAAMLAIAARDRGEIPLVYQSLIYPMLDDRTGSTRQVPPHIGTLLWTSEINRFGWSAFLGVPAGSAKVPYGAVPARVTDLRGLPATFIGVGSIDLFVDEDVEYARRLISAGVPTELHVIPGAFHGFQAIVPAAAVSKQFNATVNAALARAFSGS